MAWSLFFGLPNEVKVQDGGNWAEAPAEQVARNYLDQINVQLSSIFRVALTSVRQRIRS